MFRGDRMLRSSNNTPNGFGWGTFGNWSSSENNMNSGRDLRYRDYSPHRITASVLDPPALWLKPQSMLRQCDILQEGLERAKPLRELDQNKYGLNQYDKAKGNGKLTLRLRPETVNNNTVDTSKYVEIPIVRVSSKSSRHPGNSLSASPEENLSDYENCEDTSVPIDEFESVQLHEFPRMGSAASRHGVHYDRPKHLTSNRDPFLPVIRQGLPVSQDSPQFFANRTASSSRKDHGTPRSCGSFHYPASLQNDDLYPVNTHNDNDVMLVQVDEDSREPYVKGERWLQEDDFIMSDDDSGHSKINLTKDESKHKSRKFSGPPSPILIDDDSTTNDQLQSSKNNESDMVLIGETKDARVQKHKPRYFQQIEEDILSGDMLSDEAINLGQNLLLKQFPNIRGLEDTSLGAVYNFSECKKGQFVQILHDMSCHWVLVSNIGCKPGEVNLYDTLYYGIIKPAILKQISCIIKPKGKYLTVNVQPIQKQQNSTDCGVFDLAFATSLLNGQKPTQIVYDVAQIRPHLLSCLKTGKMTPFPALGKDGDKALMKLVEHIKPDSVKVTLVCSCRAPFDAEDKSDDLVACKSCGGLYHIKCENIPLEALEIDINWRCSKCRER